MVAINRYSSAFTLVLACLIIGPVSATQDQSAFAPITSLLTAPGATRTVTGQPGPEYWQQRVSYDIDVTLLEEKQALKGAAEVTYTNNSPEVLDTLWFALGENRFDPKSLAFQAETLPLDPEGKPRITEWELAWAASIINEPRSFAISKIQDGNGEPISFEARSSLIRLPLNKALQPGKSVRLEFFWTLMLKDLNHIPSRSGYEYFPKTDNYQFSVGQWYPRALAFTDYGGWSIRPFLGSGEFNTEFSNFDVRITVPSSHLVAGTGTLSNADTILTSDQRQRLKLAAKSDKPIFIVTPDEAQVNEAAPADKTRTWVFKARNVRDFAWASSPKFVWDAAGFHQDDKENPLVMVMSFYPSEAMPLWSQYSTELVKYTLQYYGEKTFPFPYPVMQSVNTFSRTTGMEYPMIGFNGPRPYMDPKTGLRQYGIAERDGLAEIVIHETGHNYFPMVVGSDEREFAWMDEGINTFLTHLAAMEWSDPPPATMFGTPVAALFKRAMTLEPRSPITTPVDEQHDHFQTTYFKTAGVLIVLREQILGRETFDRALSEYSRRWRFKRPTPADFFRTMEDVSGVNLDWFWRGWFFGTDTFDMAIVGVTRFIHHVESTSAIEASDSDPKEEGKDDAPAPRDPFADPVTHRHNKEQGMTAFTATRPELQDYHDQRSDKDTATARNAIRLPEDIWRDKTLEGAWSQLPYVYGVTIENKGGLLSPMALRLEYADGAEEDRVLPVEAWRVDSKKITVPVYSEREIVRFQLDPDHILPDLNLADNIFSGPVAEAPVIPGRRAGDPRGAMGLDGVALTRDGQIIHK